MPFKKSNMLNYLLLYTVAASLPHVLWSSLTTKNNYVLASISTEDVTGDQGIRTIAPTTSHNIQLETMFSGIKLTSQHTNKLSVLSTAKYFASHDTQFNHRTDANQNNIGHSITSLYNSIAFMESHQNIVSFYTKSSELANEKTPPYGSIESNMGTILPSSTIKLTNTQSYSHQVAKSTESVQEQEEVTQTMAQHRGIKSNYSSFPNAMSSSQSVIHPSELNVDKFQTLDLSKKRSNLPTESPMLFSPITNLSTGSLLFTSSIESIPEQILSVNYTVSMVSKIAPPPSTLRISSSIHINSLDTNIDSEEVLFLSQQFTEKPSTMSYKSISVSKIKDPSSYDKFLFATTPSTSRTTLKFVFSALADTISEIVSVFLPTSNTVLHESLRTLQHITSQLTAFTSEGNMEASMETLSASTHLGTLVNTWVSADNLLLTPTSVTVSDFVGTSSTSVYNIHPSFLMDSSSSKELIPTAYISTSDSNIELLTSMLSQPSHYVNITDSTSSSMPDTSIPITTIPSMGLRSEQAMSTPILSVVTDFRAMPDTDYKPTVFSTDTGDSSLLMQATATSQQDSRINTENSRMDSKVLSILSIVEERKLQTVAVTIDDSLNSISAQSEELLTKYISIHPSSSMKVSTEANNTVTTIEETLSIKKLFSSSHETTTTVDATTYLSTTARDVEISFSSLSSEVPLLSALNFSVFSGIINSQYAPSTKFNDPLETMINTDILTTQNEQINTLALQTIISNQVSNVTLDYTVSSIKDIKVNNSTRLPSFPSNEESIVFNMTATPVISLLSNSAQLSYATLSHTSTTVVPRILSPTLSLFDVKTMSVLEDLAVNASYTLYDTVEMALSTSTLLKSSSNAMNIYPLETNSNSEVQIPGDIQSNSIEDMKTGVQYMESPTSNNIVLSSSYQPSLPVLRSSKNVYATQPLSINTKMISWQDISSVNENTEQVVPYIIPSLTSLEKNLSMISTQVSKSDVISNVLNSGSSILKLSTSPIIMDQSINRSSLSAVIGKTSSTTANSIKDVSVFSEEMHSTPMSTVFTSESSTSYFVTETISASVPSLFSLTVQSSINYIPPVSSPISVESYGISYTSETDVFTIIPSSEYLLVSHNEKALSTNMVSTLQIQEISSVPTQLTDKSSNIRLVISSSISTDMENLSLFSSVPDRDMISMSTTKMTLESIIHSTSIREMKSQVEYTKLSTNNIVLSSSYQPSLPVLRSSKNVYATQPLSINTKMISWQDISSVNENTEQVVPSIISSSTFLEENLSMISTQKSKSDTISIQLVNIGSSILKLSTSAITMDESINGSTLSAVIGKTYSATASSDKDFSTFSEEMYSTTMSTISTLESLDSSYLSKEIFASVLPLSGSTAQSSINYISPVNSPIPIETYGIPYTSETDEFTVIPSSEYLLASHYEKVLSKNMVSISQNQEISTVSSQLTDKSSNIKLVTSSSIGTDMENLSLFSSVADSDMVSTRMTLESVTQSSSTQEMTIKVKYMESSSNNIVLLSSYKPSLSSLRSSEKASATQAFSLSTTMISWQDISSVLKNTEQAVSSIIPSSMSLEESLFTPSTQVSTFDTISSLLSNSESSILKSSASIAITDESIIESTLSTNLNALMTSVVTESDKYIDSSMLPLNNAFSSQPIIGKTSSTTANSIKDVSVFSEELHSTPMSTVFTSESSTSYFVTETISASVPSLFSLTVQSSINYIPPVSSPISVESYGIPFSGETNEFTVIPSSVYLLVSHYEKALSTNMVSILQNHEISSVSSQLTDKYSIERLATSQMMSTDMENVSLFSSVPDSNTVSMSTTRMLLESIVQSNSIQDMKTDIEYMESSISDIVLSSSYQPSVPVLRSFEKVSATQPLSINTMMISQQDISSVLENKEQVLSSIIPSSTFLEENLSMIPTQVSKFDTVSSLLVNSGPSILKFSTTKTITDESIIESTLSTDLNALMTTVGTRSDKYIDSSLLLLKNVFSSHIIGKPSLSTASSDKDVSSLLEELYSTAMSTVLTLESPNSSYLSKDTISTSVLPLFGSTAQSSINYVSPVSSSIPIESYRIPYTSETDEFTVIPSSEYLLVSHYGQVPSTNMVSTLQFLEISSVPTQLTDKSSNIRLVISSSISTDMENLSLFSSVPDRDLVSMSTTKMTLESIIQSTSIQEPKSEVKYTKLSTNNIVLSSSYQPSLPILRRSEKVSATQLLSINTKMISWQDISSVLENTEQAVSSIIPSSTFLEENLSMISTQKSKFDAISSLLVNSGSSILKLSTSATIVTDESVIASTIPTAYSLTTSTSNVDPKKYIESSSMEINNMEVSSHSNVIETVTYTDTSVAEDLSRSVEEIYSQVVPSTPIGSNETRNSSRMNEIKTVFLNQLLSSRHEHGNSSAMIISPSFISFSSTTFLHSSKEGFESSSIVSSYNFATTSNDQVSSAKDLSILKDLSTTSTVKEVTSALFPTSSYLYIGLTSIISMEPSTTDQLKGDISPWSLWSECSATCNGQRKRDRECYNLYNCYVHIEEVQRCGKVNCPVHGGFSKWTQWSSCSQSCGGGSSNRLRVCNSPKPSHGGSNCIGEATQEEECNQHRCPIDASPGPWTSWSACDKPCNNGTYKRTRQCSRGYYGGRDYCLEHLEEKNHCNFNVCPGIFGNFHIRLDLPYFADYNVLQSYAWQVLELHLKEEFLELFSLNFKDKLLDLVLHDTKEGSVIVNFTIAFKDFDSYQFIYIQDSLEIERSVEKLSVISVLGDYNIWPNVPTAPPSNIKFKALSATAFYVSWDDVPAGDQPEETRGYILFYRKKLDSSWYYNALASTSNNMVLTGLSPSTKYSFRMVAYSSSGNGIASEEQVHLTLEALPALPPTGVNASTVDHTSVMVEWFPVDEADMNGIPLGYNVTVYLHGAKKKTLVVPFNIRAILVDNLTPESLYMFEVCAFNKIGSGPCDNDDAKTNYSTPSSPPKNAFVAPHKTHDSLTITWDDLSFEYIHGDLLQYKIYYRVIQIGNEVIEHGNTQFVTSHSSVTSAKITGLQPNAKYELKLLAVNQHGDGVYDLLHGETCKCPEISSTAYFLQRPYIYQDTDRNLVGVCAQILDDMIFSACGTCERLSGVPVTTVDRIQDGRRRTALKTINDVTFAVDQYTDIVFPMTAPSSAETYLGYSYVPLLDHPGMVFITTHPSSREVAENMIKQVFSVWPLLLVNVLLMIFIGGLVWSLEGYYRTTDTSFSSSILSGLAEGCYWAFITQGSQGYGDFVPTRFPSRLLAILWIVMGLIMTSLIVGKIVTSLASINESSDVKLYGTEVGVINGSVEARMAILRNAKVSTKTAYTSVEQLLYALKNGDVEGILIDVYTASAFQQEISTSTFRIAEIMQYKHSYGFVLSGQLNNVAAEVRDYINTHQGRILSIIENTTSKLELSPKKEYKSILDPKSETFLSAITWLFLLYLIGFVCGCAHWCWMRFKSRRRIGIVVTKSNLIENEIRELAGSILITLTSHLDKMNCMEDRHIRQRVKFREKKKRRWRTLLRTILQPKEPTIENAVDIVDVACSSKSNDGSFDDSKIFIRPNGPTVENAVDIVGVACSSKSNDGSFDDSKISLHI